MGTDLRSRITSHAEKVKKAEQLQAALAGVFDQDTLAKSERFEAFVKEVVKPAFDEFKLTLREIGKDAEILLRGPNHPRHSIALVLMERYLSFGSGKTIKLVNPKEDVTERKTTKFYEVYRSDDLIFVRQRWCAEIDSVSTLVTYEDVVAPFFENDLAAFFERAYPMVAAI